MAKKIQKVETKTVVVYLEESMTLADVIKKLVEQGVTDLSKVTYDHEYVGCQCDHGDNYCYCDGSYRDMRFRGEV